jgi:DNA-binding transcriptional ArsR family regulator
VVEQVSQVDTIFKHPLRVAIVETILAADGGKLSPKEIAERLGAPLGTVSYHVRELAAAKILRPAGKTPRRGAIQHYYRVDADRLSSCAGELVQFALRLDELVKRAPTAPDRAAVNA